MADKVFELYRKIYLRYGAIKRSRGNFLYTKKEVRLVDMFLEGGRAILGWGSDHSSAFTLVKNVISRGLTGPFFTEFSPFTDNTDKKTPLSRAVTQLFGNERTAFLVQSKQAALQLAVSMSSDSTSVFTPWLSGDVDWRRVKSIVLKAPFAWTGDFWIVAAEDSIVTKEIIESCAACPQVNAAVEQGIVRSIYDLIKALQFRSEKDWFLYDRVLTKYWTRKGPYLYPKIEQDEYDGFVEHCLECGLVISPIYQVPSIVPYGANPGVFSALEKNPYGTK